MSDRREDGRKPTFKSGTISLGSDSQQVRILNLSGGGAMIDAAHAVPEDAELIFDSAETGPTAARVAWTLGKRCGLTFEHVVELQAEDDIAA